MLPIMLIVGYFVNEARMYLPDLIEEWREEKAMNEELKEIVEGTGQKEYTYPMKR